MNDAAPNYTKEAFLLLPNLVFITAAMLTVLILSGVNVGPDWLFETMLLFTAALELLYLGVVPRNERFRRAIRARQAEAHRKPPSPKETFRRLSRESQRRYARLRRLEKEIAANYRKLPYAAQGLLKSHTQKLDGLLASYLNLLLQKERYEAYAGGTSEAEVARARDALREDMADDAERVKSIKARRMRVLEQRLARFEKGRENIEVITAQIETVEDVLKYIHEQSWTLQNPDAVTHQLDALLDEVEETQASVQEIEDVFGPPTAPLLDDLDAYEAPASEGAARAPKRSRQRG